jgi:chromosome segregation ATPase
MVKPTRARPRRRSATHGRVAPTGAAAPKPQRDLERLGRELLTTKKKLRGAEQRLAQAREELQSANEELQSSNEELLSANEELQSSNEELQSSNEELDATNVLLSEKLDELPVPNATERGSRRSRERCGCLGIPTRASSLSRCRRLSEP